MPNEKWRKDFTRLWKKLVPLQGQADTVQGELIRAVGRLSDEAFRNGNRNFSRNHQALCRSMRETLNDPEVFSAAELLEIHRCATRVLRSKNSDIDGPTTSFHRLAEYAVRWCAAHPEPIHRQLDPKLRI
jgi:hypothetical protein